MNKLSSIWIIIGVYFFFGLEDLDAQNTWQSTTLFHEDGALKEKPVRIDFLDQDLHIRHPRLEALHVYWLDSVSFEEDIPELEELHGTPAKIRFSVRDHRIEPEPHTPEFYAIFAAYHTLYAINYYKRHFGDLVEFPNKNKYRELDLYLGDYINCNPEQYVLNPAKRVSPTVIYHEVGHRAFCQLDDTLAIGNTFTMVHNGLMEYFTTSMADHPVIGEGMLPPRLTRDASKPVKYPEDKYYFDHFIKDLGEAINKDMDCEEATRRLYQLNMERAQRISKRILMTHQTGMLITHPLWELREEAGSEMTDSLVVHAMRNLHRVAEKRDTTIQHHTGTSEEEYPSWRDLLRSLYRSDQELFGGRYREVIRKVFSESGFETGQTDQTNL